MVDLELGPDLYDGLKEEFGRYPEWPRGVAEAASLLCAVAKHLERNELVLFLRCADMANARFERPTNVGQQYHDALGAARALFPRLNDSEEVDLLWPVLRAVCEMVAPECRGRFMVGALAGLEGVAEAVG